MINQIAKKYKKGQILLLSLLVMIVALTIGLSLAARTISTLHTTSAEDNSQKAFSAAEAGIERALTSYTNDSFIGDLDTNTSYNATVTTLSGSIISLNNKNLIQKDEPVDVWLSNYPNYSAPWNGTLSVYWGSASDICDKSENINTQTALEIILISGTKNSPNINHLAYDPCDNRRSTSNHFSAVPAASGGNVDGRTYAYRVNFLVTSGLLARIVPLHAGTYIAVTGIDPVTGLGLPSQGTIITSIGNSGDTQRKIVTYRSYPKAPIELFPFLIFSPK